MEQRIPSYQHPGFKFGGEKSWGTYDSSQSTTVQENHSFKFFSLDDQQPLCEQCESLRFVNINHGVHSVPGSCEVVLNPITQCPLCMFVHQTLLNEVKRTYGRDLSVYQHQINPDTQSYYRYEDETERVNALQRDKTAFLLHGRQKYIVADGEGLELDSLSVLSACDELLPLAESISSYGGVRTGLWRSDFMIDDTEEKIASLERAYATARFSLHSYRDQPLSSIVPGKSIIADMASDASIKMLQKWISDCETSHSSCLPTYNSLLPTRLIDVGDGMGEPVKLWITNQDHIPGKVCAPDRRYIALSYCWGIQNNPTGAPTFATTASSLEKHTTAIPEASLPKTLRDAISFTRLLGIRYLWADSLCIIQGDSPEARQDWLAEASRMSDVYGNAWLTIAAAWGSTMHHGIFTTRPTDPPGYLEIGLASIHDFKQRGKIKIVPSRYMVLSLTQPLFQRAWALQERMLSKRVLICNQDQFLWECQEIKFTESGSRQSDPRNRGVRFDDKFPTSLRDENGYLVTIWHDIVRDYSSRNLTRFSDKLPAIGGLAKRFHQLFPMDTYLAGLWKNSLAEDLLWCRKLPIRKAKEKVNPEFGGNRVPTWSWASVEGGVDWMFEADPKSLIELLDIFVDPADNDSFGEVQNAHLIIRASCFQIPDELKRYTLGIEPEEFEEKAVAYDMQGARITDRERLNKVLGISKGSHWNPTDDRKPYVLASIDCFLLRVIKNISLIVVSPRVFDTDQPRCYERAGLISVWDNDAGWISKCQTTTCKLI